MVEEELGGRIKRLMDRLAYVAPEDIAMKATHIELFAEALVTRAEARGYAACKARIADLERETIICAAIRLPDGRVIRGHRHDSCIRTAEEMVSWQHDPRSGVNGPPWEASMCSDQGFVTSRNRYVGRIEAMEIHRAAGGKSACYGELRGDVLFSEDLY